MPFIDSNYSFEIVILVISKKLSKLVFFVSAYYAHCTFRRREVEGLVKCSLTFKFWHLIKRGAYFETRRKEIIIYSPFDFEIVKCDILSVEMFTSYVSNS